MPAPGSFLLCGISKPSHLKNRQLEFGLIFHLLGCTHRRVIIHSFCLRAVSAVRNLAAFAAAAAFGRKHPDHFVPGLQRVSPQREEVPGSQHRRQTRGLPLLQHIYHNDDDQHGQQGRSHADQHPPACQGEAEDEQGEEEEAADDVDHSKPAVGGSDVAQGFSHPDGEPSEGDGVPQDDARDVEQEVYEGDLGET